MRFLGKILEGSWFNHPELLSSNDSKEDQKDVPKQDNDFQLPYDISATHFEDEGGIYLLAFDDWSSDDLQEFLHKSSFIDDWERRMDETGLAVVSGRIGKSHRDNIQIVHTSLSEVFEHEEDE